MAKGRPIRSFEERMVAFGEKVQVVESGCWLWTGAINKGYGQFNACEAEAMRQRRARKKKAS